MRLIGAVLAGGRSRRFGSDKALAPVDGQMLMDHAVRALTPQVEQVVSCGRSWPGTTTLEDHPRPDLGPLGGLSAALHFAAEAGFNAVVSVSVDSYPIPHDLVARLAGDGPRYVSLHYLLGFWPSSLSDRLDRHLADGHRSVRSWIEACGAVPVEDDGMAIANINTPADLPPS